MILVRIQEINAFRRSTQSIDPITTTNPPPTTSLVFTSTRRYGPRFLTPPPTMSSRPPTPLSYSVQSTTPQPIRRLPPIVPPRLGNSTLIDCVFLISNFRSKCKHPATLCNCSNVYYSY